MRHVDFDHWPYPRLVAHRGAGRLAPENTLGAFRLGAGFGYRMFEFDVKLSRDGVPFLLHDDDLDRTTDGRGPADQFDWPALAEQDAGGWHSPAWVGEPLPRFAVIARYLRANDFLADVEIKPSSGREAETGRVVANACMQAWAGASIPPLLTSFSEVALAAAGEAQPSLPRGLLLSRLPPDWLERLQRHRAVALVANHQVLDAAVVAAARQARFRVACYTANDPDRVATLFEWGVDCVITDAVDRIPVQSGLA